MIMCWCFVLLGFVYKVLKGLCVGEFVCGKRLCFKDVFFGIWWMGFGFKVFSCV